VRSLRPGSRLRQNPPQTRSGRHNRAAGAGSARVTFDTPQRAITPGQAAVFLPRHVVQGGAGFVDSNFQRFVFGNGRMRCKWLCVMPMPRPDYAESASCRRTPFPLHFPVFSTHMILDWSPLIPLLSGRSCRPKEKFTWPFVSSFGYFHVDAHPIRRSRRSGRSCLQAGLHVHTPRALSLDTTGPPSLFHSRPALTASRSSPCHYPQTFCIAEQC